VFETGVYMMGRMKASKIKIKQDKTSKMWLNQAKSYENKLILLERYDQVTSLRPCEASSEDRGELGRVGEKANFC